LEAKSVRVIMFVPGLRLSACEVPDGTGVPFTRMVVPASAAVGVRPIAASKTSPTV
jgi:hypothetical protein